eukprot:evm.model.scf_530.4 EVM.evm.TU.scf_530.4   scf_530:68256-69076(+)
MASDDKEARGGEEQVDGGDGERADSGGDECELTEEPTFDLGMGGAVPVPTDERPASAVDEGDVIDLDPNKGMRPAGEIGAGGQMAGEAPRPAAEAQAADANAVEAGEGGGEAAAPAAGGADGVEAADRDKQEAGVGATPVRRVVRRGSVGMGLPSLARIPCRSAMLARKLSGPRALTSDGDPGARRHQASRRRRDAGWMGRCKAPRTERE